MEKQDDPITLEESSFLGRLIISAFMLVMSSLSIYLNYNWFIPQIYEIRPITFIESMGLTIFVTALIDFKIRTDRDNRRIAQTTISEVVISILENAATVIGAGAIIKFVVM